MSNSKIGVRLTRDIEILTNSPFWIEALKNGHARGISRQLNIQFIESQEFMAGFIKYAVKCKQTSLNASISDAMASTEDQTIDINNNQEEASDKFLTISVEFLIEAIFLAVLNFEDYIGNSSDIIKTILAWFPELRNLASYVLKATTDTILSTTACFKRCLIKTLDISRPTILGKHQHKWSINHNFIKPFVRHYYRQLDSKLGEIKISNFVKSDHLSPTFSIPLQKQPSILPFRKPRPTPTELPVSQLSIDEQQALTKFNRTDLFTSWKSKVEQFRLLLQIQHTNVKFSWYDSVDRLDFIDQSHSIRRPQKTKLQEHICSTLKPKAARKDLRKPDINTAVVDVAPQPTEPPTTTTFQLENILTCDDLNVKNHHISSMISISENYNPSFFNILPISPGAMCYTHSFFSNQTEMGCVEEMFSDTI